jgi:hypothetical protein
MQTEETLHSILDSNGIEEVPKLNGRICPKCGNNLYDSIPVMILTSIPPQLNTHCCKCDYKGYRIL